MMRTSIFLKNIKTIKMKSSVFFVVIAMVFMMGCTELSKKVELKKETTDSKACPGGVYYTASVESELCGNEQYQYLGDISNHQRFEVCIPAGDTLKLEQAYGNVGGIFGFWFQSEDRFSVIHTETHEIFYGKLIMQMDCQFIDLWIRNPNSTPITIRGFIIGE